jgi:hypothetical protein
MNYCFDPTMAPEGKSMIVIRRRIYVIKQEPDEESESFYSRSEDVLYGWPMALPRRRNASGSSIRQMGNKIYLQRRKNENTDYLISDKGYDADWLSITYLSRL